MEKEKRKKILKILTWVGFGLLIALIIVLCSLSIYYKNQTNDLNDKNDEIEDVLIDSSSPVLEEAQNFITKILID